MPNRLSEALRRVRQVLSPDGDALPDGQLLGRFLAVRDEAAFAALVRRHGPMVLGVCRRVLRHAQDAEDAFQATFLLLARKAGAVRTPESVGSWLYGVAYRTALEARAAADRRRVREKQVAQMPDVAVLPAEPQDWRPLLDRELSRLPERYRRVLVLCDLEARPRKEAAAVLGLPAGTLFSRLVRGRELLARRLRKYGLSLPVAAFASALVGGASAAVPAPLVSSTAKAAALVAAGQLAALATPAAALTTGVVKAMFLSKLKVAVAVLATALVVAGTGTFAYRSAGGEPGGTPAASEGGAGASKAAQPLEALRDKLEAAKARAARAKAEAERARAAASSAAAVARLAVQLEEREVDRSRAATPDNRWPHLRPLPARNRCRRWCCAAEPQLLPAFPSEPSGYPPIAYGPDASTDRSPPLKESRRKPECWLAC
jgi:RNA polymerase sigma factor (sigma-70 family)